MEDEKKLVGNTVPAENPGADLLDAQSQNDIEQNVVSPNDMPLSRIIDWSKKRATDDDTSATPAASAVPSKKEVQPSNSAKAPAPEATNQMQPVNVEPSQDSDTEDTDRARYEELKSKPGKTASERVELGKLAHRFGPKPDIRRRENRPKAYPDKATQEAMYKVQHGEPLTEQEKAKVTEVIANTPVPRQSDDNLDDEAGGTAPSTGADGVTAPSAGKGEVNVSSGNAQDGKSAEAQNGGQSGEVVSTDADPYGEYDPNKYIRQAVGHIEKPTKEEYDALIAKQKKGEYMSLDDRHAIVAYEQMPGEAPQPPKYEEYKVLEMPPAASYTQNFDNAYANMLARMKAYGDDPASKAKRAKARRAAKIIAMIGDLLQASINMWGAYKGAQSAKLTSQSKAVRDQEQKEEALAMKRAEQYEKRLETARKADRDIAKAIDSRLIEKWKELNKARAEVVKNKNASLKEAYERAWSNYNEAWKDYWRAQRDVRLQYDKEINAATNHSNRIAQQNNQYRNQSKLSSQRHQEAKERQDNAYEHSKGLAQFKENLKDED